jgi:hypothetical protein
VEPEDVQAIWPVNQQLDVGPNAARIQSPERAWPGGASRCEPTG